MEVGSLKAIISYKKALQLKSDYINAHYGLGNAYYELGRYQDAIASYRDSLQTNIPNIAEQELVNLKTLVKRGEYNSWEKSFEDLADERLVTRDMEKPHHISQEQRVQVHLKPYFDKLKVRDIIEQDEKTGKSMVSDFLAEIDHMPKESVKKIRYCLKSILKKGNQNYELPRITF